MAYCRWSSMEGRCDVYAYEDVHGGYTIHLAARKRKNIDKAPPFPSIEILMNNIDEFKKVSKKYKEWLNSDEAQEFENLTLKHAGETFREDDLEDFRNRMTYLHELGYTFPNDVFECIDEEIKERDNDLF